MSRFILGSVDVSSFSGLGDCRGPVRLELDVDGERRERGGTDAERLRLRVDDVELVLEGYALRRFVALVGALEGKIR